MKELARAKVKNGRITIPPNIRDRLLLDENDKVSFFEHRGRIMIRKYRVTGADSARERDPTRAPDFKVEQGGAFFRSSGIPFNPLDPAFHENIQNSLRDMLGNEETREMLKKTADELTKLFPIGKVFENMFTTEDTINLDDMDYEQGSPPEENNDPVSRTREKSRKKKDSDDDDEEEFQIDIE